MIEQNKLACIEETGRRKWASSVHMNGIGVFRLGTIRLNQNSGHTAFYAALITSKPSSISAHWNRYRGSAVGPLGNVCSEEQHQSDIKMFFALSTSALDNLLRGLAETEPCRR